MHNPLLSTAFVFSFAVTNFASADTLHSLLIRDVVIIDGSGSAAMQTAAQMIQLDQEIGTVSVGKTADLLLLNHDPLKDPKAFRDISFVIRSGEAKTPSEWLK